MTRFEYKTIELPRKRKNTFSLLRIDKEALDGSLKSLGEQGWELISKIESTSGGTILKTVLIFKRTV
jgi:hypothetical protein